MLSQDLLMPWGDQIYQWRTGDRSQMTRIHELLAVIGCRVSYSSLRRFTVKANPERCASYTRRRRSVGRQTPSTNATVR